MCGARVCILLLYEAATPVGAAIGSTDTLRAVKSDGVRLGLLVGRCLLIVRPRGTEEEAEREDDETERDILVD
jgi:hypothetical protein